MSGRGRGRSNGGRGRGRSSGRYNRDSGRGGRSYNTQYNKSFKSHQTKKSVTDYVFFIGSSKQASEFEETKAFLINHIKKTFTFGIDIGTALEDETAARFAAPRLQKSVSTVDDVKALEDEQFKIEFKEEFNLYMKRKNMYEDNLIKAYAFLWERCSKGLQHEIESNTSFDWTIKGDPVELMKSIKLYALSYQEEKYDMSIVYDAMRYLITLRQREEESLQEYTRRFKTSRDVMVSHLGGSIHLNKVVKARDDYVDLDIQDVAMTIADVRNAVSTNEGHQEEEFARFMAFIYIYLENCDRAKYGSLLSTLATQYSLGNDQYPKTITDATAILSAYKYDKTYSDNKKKAYEKARAKEKEDETPLNLSFAQMKGKCYCCGKSDHMSPDCPDKDKPKKEWAIAKFTAKQGQSHAQSGRKSSNNQERNAGESTPSNNQSENENGDSFSWNGAHIQLNQVSKYEEMKDWILLDNQSTVHIFCNKKYAKNIHTVLGELNLATNGGELTTNKKATVKMVGEVWFADHAITNVISLSEMEKKYRITYDTSKGQAFIVHVTPKHQVKFELTENGLYAYKPKESTSANCFVESVKDNQRDYTERELQRAKRARNLYHSLAVPSIGDFKTIIKMNAISGNPVTLEDVEMAERIYGPSIASLKGKVTRQRPKPVVSSVVPVPKALYQNNAKVVLCIDAFILNGLPFFTTISKKICYRTSSWIPSQTVKAYRSELIKIFRIYNTAGFLVTEIYCDNEFRPLVESLQDEFNISVNFAAPQEHVPEVERSIRVIKERVRGLFHYLPFTHLPKKVVKMMAMECTKKLNYFPAKHGISEFYSPRMIMHQRTLEYAKHCSIPFCTYVQAHTENMPTNTMKPRTLDALYMRHTDNHQGGHEVLDLRTNSLITRPKVTPLPITQPVIDVVHGIAEREGCPKGLQLTTRNKTVLYDSSWIAGVDYAIQDPEDEGEEEENNEDEPDQEADENMDEIDPEEVEEEANPNDVIEDIEDENEPEEPVIVEDVDEQDKQEEYVLVDEEEEKEDYVT